MRTKPMTQWAPGTRLQRMNRADGTYAMEMEALNQRVEEAKKTKATAKPTHIPGQVVLVGENIEIVQDVDPNGSWVNIRGHKYSVDICKPVPIWFTKAYIKLLTEMNNEN